jgi:hypothetical protein
MSAALLSPSSFVTAGRPPPHYMALSRSSSDDFVIVIPTDAIPSAYSISAAAAASTAARSAARSPAH